MTSTTTAPAPSPSVAAPAAASAPLSVTSLVLGLVSVAAGFTLVVPIVGLVLGVLARRREPEARTFSTIGIVANAVMLAGAAIVLGLGLAVGVPLGVAHLLGGLG
ncbi:hypothetical protein IFT72_03895 [Frigoribacterium sp. CFBP 8754]|uniref:hypothetical protein n=1 Tax=Frigoribacterium sp. CFBP 8754 TaxID=2775290 RepID=UPI0017866307|nr:hypothetical protein [Frigoribacterium sp. CFBP 8754]MBD8659333.1 hypothetical protein [Frigoribacterium sp. CFBP 8754]